MVVFFSLNHSSNTKLLTMKNIEKQMNIGYVSHVEIIDVEKRFLSGPKHYVSYSD